MTKKQQLEKIDDLLLDKIIYCLENNETELLPELNVVVQILSKNNVVSEKSKSSVEDDIEKKIVDAKARRKNTNKEKVS